MMCVTDHVVGVVIKHEVQEKNVYAICRCGGS